MDGQQSPRRQRGGDQAQQLLAFAAAHAVDHAAEHQATQTRGGHGAQVLAERLVPQVDHAQRALFDQMGAGIDPVGIDLGLVEPLHQPAVTAGRVQHPTLDLGGGVNGRLNPPRIGAVQRPGTR